MEQLSEMDSNFLLQESVDTPMHISPVVIYDPSGRPGGRVRFKEILETFRANLSRSTVFRRKLAGGAMGLDAPFWVEDPTFDLEFHVRHIALPKPGDWRQLCIQVARLHARPLDLSKPLRGYEAPGFQGVPDLLELDSHVGHGLEAALRSPAQRVHRHDRGVEQLTGE